MSVPHDAHAPEDHAAPRDAGCVFHSPLTDVSSCSPNACGAGQFCLTQLGQLDASPRGHSCWPSLPQCGCAPTCACLLDAGVCPGTCEGDGQSAEITCPQPPMK